MEKTMQISGELKNWIMNTLDRGVKPEAVVDAMVRKGYDTRASYTILFRIVQDRAQHAYVYETPEIGLKGNILHTSDRDIKVLSKVEKPFILHLDNVLSDEECDELIAISKVRLKPSMVIDSKTGEEKKAQGRTSKGMYFGLGENHLVTTIEKRISELTNFPIENGEGLQVLNYDIGEEYKAHYDYFPKQKVDPTKGGQRLGTFLLYLNDVADGGETVFPKVGASIVPKKGTAVYFHYGNSKGQVDPLSLHASIPIVQGEKWVATKWIRQQNIYQHR